VVGVLDGGSDVGGEGAEAGFGGAAAWPPGVYVVLVEASGRTASARLVVVR
jgi:hypothetical protein